MSNSDFINEINTLLSSNNDLGIVELCTSAIADGKFLADAYFNRGLARLRLKTLNEAVDDFDKYIEINPNNYFAYNNRANAKMLLNLNKEAIDDFGKAIELSPSKSDLYFNRANAKFNLRSFTDAIVDYNVAIDLQPFDSGYYLNRALAYVEINELNQALEDASAAIRIDPQNGICIQAKYHIEQLLREDKRSKENHEQLEQLEIRYRKELESREKQRDEDNRILLNKLEHRYKNELNLTKSKYETDISLLREENKNLKIQEKLNDAIEITFEFDKRSKIHRYISIFSLVCLILWTISVLCMVTVSLLDWSDSIIGVTNMKNHGLNEISYWEVYPYSQTFLLHVHKLTIWQHYIMLVPLLFIEYLLYTIYLRNMKLANFYHHKSTVGKSLEKLKLHYFDVGQIEDKKEFRKFLLEQYQELYQTPSFIEKQSFFAKHGSSEIKIDADGSISKKDKK